MLVLTRREGERIALGEDIILTVVSIQGNKVRLGITAPDDVTVRRGELLGDETSHPGRKVAEKV